MKLSKAVFLVVTVILSTISSYGFCDETKDRETVKSDVIRLLSQSKFSELESLSKTYLNTQARTSSGLWKLTLFYQGIKSAFMTRQLDKQYWSTLEETTNQWIKLYPNSATARLAYAHVLSAHAWAYRGTGYVNTVDPKNWEPFHYYIDQERIYLLKNKKIASTDPIWYQSMLSIATYQSWEEDKFAPLLDEALERFPNFYQIYFAALDYYVPKWGGNVAKVEKFARDSIDRTLKTEGYGMYARIYWAASQSEFGTSLFTDSLADWPTMKKGIDDVLKKYPDSWNINNFAYFSCMAGDKKKTLELINRIDGLPSLIAWGDMDTFNYCKSMSLSK